MRKFFFFFLLTLFISSSLHAQLAVFKMVGRNSGNSTFGFGAFAYWDIPINETGNRSVMIELLDFAYFPQKNSDINSVLGYVSIKAGFRYIFSEESKTGFFVEPSAGYCRVVNSEGPDGTYGDGIAVAAEAGYSLEIGKQSNTLVFGLKFESDMAGTNTSVSAISLRFSYSFHLWRRRSRG